jgi:hypothetical protein
MALCNSVLGYEDIFYVRDTHIWERVLKLYRTASSSSDTLYRSYFKGISANIEL